jgi:hypothetical protein
MNYAPVEAIPSTGSRYFSLLGAAKPHKIMIHIRKPPRAAAEKQRNNSEKTAA